MRNITEEETQPIFLARPRKEETKSLDRNIFAHMRATQPLPKVSKMKGKEYDFVGPRDFKQKIMQTQKIEQKANNNEEFNQTGFDSNNMMNTTINRQTIISKMSRDQADMLTKQARHLNRYKQFQSQWESDQRKMHRLSHRKVNQKTLIENNVKDLYVQPNHDKIAVLNDFVVHYWQMSLRNNNRILERHIKGNTFARVELEKLMQFQKGMSKIENSIPKLPMDQLRKTKKRNLSLTGRNKALSETQGSGFSSARFNTTTNSANQEEVFKVNYDGAMKFMANQGL